jgi:carbon monoxide dehydrogenase subunit G
MKVQLDKSFPMPGSADTVWALLQDIEAVATCMPGAKITERISAELYKGTVAVKFGPANLSFRGEVQVLANDAAARTLHLVGKGTDSTGGSAASLDLNARVQPIDALSCELVGTSEMSLSGKAATFGGRMAGAVSDQVLKQFAANFAAKVQALQGPAAPATTVSSHAAASSTAEPAPVSSSASAAASAGSGAAAPPPAPLNGLALIWAMLKDWWRSLTSAHKA